MDYNKYYAEQIEWYTKQNVFCAEQIEWYGKEIKRSRKEDKELAEFALQNGKEDQTLQAIFGENYMSSSTRKLINTRAKYYREVKNNNKRIEHYKKMLNR